MGTNAGDLRWKVSIYRLVRDEDPVGGTPKDLVFDRKVFARVDPVTARERMRFDQQHMVITHRITMRWYGAGAPDYTTGLSTHNWIFFEPVKDLFDCSDTFDDSLYFDGVRMFRVKSVENVERKNRWMVAFCEEWAP